MPNPGSPLCYAPCPDPAPPCPEPTQLNVYVFTQSAPLSLWTINHNLGFRPSIELFDVAGQEIDANVVHISVNTAQVYFTTAAAGSARCN